MQWFSIQMLKDLDTLPNGQNLRRGNELYAESCNQFIHEFIELHGNSANNLQVFPISIKGTSLSRTDSREVFFNKNGPHTSTKFSRCSCRSS